MDIFPAIDIIDGKVVRLNKGEYDTVKYYSCSVTDAVKAFVGCGATHIHAVDLDGAKVGKAVNASSVEKIVTAFGAFVEIGGGIRSEEQIASYLSAGVERVILGTAAVRDAEFTKRMIDKYGSKIAIGVDAKDGKVSVSGWRESTDIDAFDFCKDLKRMGVKTVIYTDISRDGMLNGTNLDAYRELVKIDGLNITASGGITTLDEIVELKSMGVTAAILGKALYENKLSLADAVKIAEEK